MLQFTHRKSVRRERCAPGKVCVRKGVLPEKCAPGKACVRESVRLQNLGNLSVSSFLHLRLKKLEQATTIYLLNTTFATTHIKCLCTRFITVNTTLYENSFKLLKNYRNICRSAMYGLEHTPHRGTSAVRRFSEQSTQNT